MSAVPLAAFALLLVAVTAPAQVPEPAPNKVKVMFAAMREGQYKHEVVGFPDLSWSDIPALLEKAESTHELKNFPTNPLSSRVEKTCTEGVMALWLVEGLRKGNKYASLNAALVRAEDAERVPGKTEEATQALAARAYRSWWTKAKDLPPAKARENNPLEGSGLQWWGLVGGFR